MSKLFKNLPPGLTIAVGVALVILLSLGTWQMQRLHWKEQLLADLERSRALTPVAAKVLLDSPGQHAWRRVDLPCRIDPAKVVYMHAVVDGVAGFQALTTCPLGTKNILADLGFTSEKNSLRTLVDVQLTGRLRPFETPNGFVPPNDLATGDWYTRSVADLSEHWKTRLRDDYFIAASTPVALVLTPVDASANLPNRHLEYALTWYGLAATLVGVYIAVLYSRSRKEKE